MDAITYLCVSYLCLRIISRKWSKTLKQFVVKMKLDYIGIVCKNTFLTSKSKYLSVNLANT